MTAYNFLRLSKEEQRRRYDEARRRALSTTATDGDELLFQNMTLWMSVDSNRIPFANAYGTSTAESFSNTSDSVSSSDCSSGSCDSGGF